MKNKGQHLQLLAITYKLEFKEAEAATGFFKRIKLGDV